MSLPAIEMSLFSRVPAEGLTRERFERIATALRGISSLVSEVFGRTGVSRFLRDAILDGVVAFALRGFSYTAIVSLVGSLPNLARMIKDGVWQGRIYAGLVRIHLDPMDVGERFSEGHYDFSFGDGIGFKKRVGSWRILYAVQPGGFINILEIGERDVVCP
jgi:hypothetical protein